VTVVTFADGGYTLVVKNYAINILEFKCFKDGQIDLEGDGEKGIWMRLGSLAVDYRVRIP
jgi:hypothetical protein